MFQIVVFPPEPAAAAVEPFRRLHDPAFHRVAPHVALVPPFEENDALGLRARLAAFRPPPSPTIGFGPPCVQGRSLCLPVAEGEAGLADVVAALCSEVLPLAARLQRNGDVPSLRVGLLGSEPELELARRSLRAALPEIAPFRPDAIVLLMDDVRGLWHEVQRVSWR